MIPRSAPTPQEGRLPLVAVVDIGSNTIRLVEYEVVGRAGLRVVRAFKEVPRLGDALVGDGRLGPEAVRRGCRAVRRLLARLPPAPRRTVVAVATSAVRDAPDRAEFLKQLRTTAGLSARVLTGEEEGRYAALGVAGAWQLRSDLVVDLGGGSMQVVRTRRGRLTESRSLPLGTVRLTHRFLEHDPPRERETDALRAHVAEALARLPDAPRGARVFVVGGTARALARTSMELSESPLRTVHGHPLGTKELKGLASVLRTMPEKRRREVPGLDRSRAQVIVAGLLTLGEVAERFAPDGLTVSAHGIRDGIAQETARLPPADSAAELVDRSAVLAARSFRFPLEHGEEVAARAGELFRAVAPRLGWHEEEELALHAGALLHDVGSVIDTWQHALHSAYILRHTAVGGLSRRATGLAVLAVACHEGEPLPEGWRRRWRTVLSEEELATAERLGALLFLSERLTGLGLGFRLSRGRERLILTARGGAPRKPRAEPRFDRLEKHIRRTLGLGLDLRA